MRGRRIACARSKPGSRRTSRSPWIRLSLPPSSTHALAGRADLSAARAEAAMAAAQVSKDQAEGRWDASINLGYQRQDMNFGGLNGVTSSGALRPIQDAFNYF